MKMTLHTQCSHLVQFFWTLVWILTFLKKLVWWSVFKQKSLDLIKNGRKNDENWTLETCIGKSNNLSDTTMYVFPSSAKTIIRCISISSFTGTPWYDIGRQLPSSKSSQHLAPDWSNKVKYSSEAETYVSTFEYSYIIVLVLILARGTIPIIECVLPSIL